MLSQGDLILHHLRSGRSINPMEALREFGCFRLGARIYDLRAEGHTINSTPTKVGDKTFSTYSLVSEAKPEGLSQ